MHRTRRIVLTLSALLAVAPLASCAAPTQTAEPTASVSTSAQNGGPVSSQHNDADTMFAQMMIVHHEGAIEMAEAALTNAGSAEIKALAERISAAQGPEIDQMTSWLQAWGEQQGFLQGFINRRLWPYLKLGQAAQHFVAGLLGALRMTVRAQTARRLGQHRRRRRATPRSWR